MRPSKFRLPERTPTATRSPWIHNTAHDTGDHGLQHISDHKKQLSRYDDNSLQKFHKKSSTIFWAILHTSGQRDTTWPTLCSSPVLAGRWNYIHRRLWHFLCHRLASVPLATEHFPPWMWKRRHYKLFQHLNPDLKPFFCPLFNDIWL